MTFIGPYAIKPNIYLKYMDEKDLALNDIQWLLCHKTKTKNTSELVYTYKKNFTLNDFQWFICHETKQKQTKSYLFNIYS